MKAWPAGVLLILLLLPANFVPAAGAGDSGWSPPPDARERLERILEDPVFQLQDPEPGLAERIMARFRGFLIRSIHTIASVLALNAVLVTALLWVVIGLALFCAGWLIVRLTRDRLSFPETGSPVARGSVVEPDRSASPAKLLAGARAALRAGRGRDVLRLCLQASILALRCAGHLPDDRSMTDLEGAQVLERTGPVNLRKPFRTLARSHERLVYAGRPAQTGELNRAIDLAGGIIRGERGPDGTGDTR